ncbi:unnamed protein product, partial [Ixodes hexagonus]
MRLTHILRCVSRLPKDYANLPESYVKRSMEQVEWRTPRAPQYQRKVIQRTRFHYNMSRPWTEEFKQANMPGVKRRQIYVEPIVWTVFRGDRVEVLVGKDKGKQGIVNYVVKERNWVTVEGLNCYYRHVRNSGQLQVTKVEAPLLVTTQVALLDPTDNKPTQVEWRYTEEGKKVRVSARTGRILPIPLMAEETIDYKSKQTYFGEFALCSVLGVMRSVFVLSLMSF